ncbi:hypothetical protein SAMN04487983_103127 [Streptomyces sp. yr375]|uniref:hypothetical protein n=1 Tax=Streptomyces sp. yr375 TaxID=1761906 RepID=UPI0008D6E31A|nr:hypothetical protein [Streptomyces sp. yr375]SES09885.1 hypothetical protein SAMN04487983_103127 [Streptomyces sp. yr375]
MGAMPESVPVRCPACRRERLYTAPSYPCACGAPVTPVLDARTAPTTVAHRTWDDDWIALCCPACGRRDQWPHPELGCTCGTVLRIPVATPYATPEPPPSTPAPSPSPIPSAQPRAFRPIAIRTARDAVTATALYLNWLGHGDIRRADQRPTSGVGLAARGLLAQVDPSVHPASLRDVECLWLTAMTESADCVYFSLAGYDDDARARADHLRVPLFVLDLTGTPQPVNAVADALDARGSNR